MTDSRLDQLRTMIARFPDDPRARFFLAHELSKAEGWEEAAEHYRAYVTIGAGGDVGAGWKSLGECLERLGRVEEAAEAYRQGIPAARAHGHAGLAAEIETALDDLTR